MQCWSVPPCFRPFHAARLGGHWPQCFSQIRSGSKARSRTAALKRLKKSCLTEFQRTKLPGRGSTVLADLRQGGVRRRVAFGMAADGVVCRTFSPSIPIFGRPGAPRRSAVGRIGSRGRGIAARSSRCPGSQGTPTARRGPRRERGLR